MAVIPACTKLRRTCRELDVTIAISDLASDSPGEQDAAATWELGHDQRVTFGTPYKRSGELRVDATIHVPCKYLKAAAASNGTENATCTAYGFTGPMPESTQPAERMTLLNSDGDCVLVHESVQQQIKINPKKVKKGALPVIQPDNPCQTAQCRTADNRIGAACCRDLKLELFLPKKRQNLELLLRTRRSPLVCKVKREDSDTVECEVISACGYLGADDRSCVLHDMVRPNGKSAKPQLCYDWPELEEDEAAHPGCVLVSRD